MRYKVISNSPGAVWISSTIISDRIDTNYYRADFIENDISTKNIPTILLKDILKSPLTDFGSFSLTKEIEYVSDGIPYIRSSDFKEFFIDELGMAFISENTNKILKKSEVLEGDILITKMGSDMGKGAIINKIPYGSKKCNSNATVAKVRIKDGIDKYYLVAYLNSKYSVNSVWRNAVGSVQPRVNLADIESYVIPIPSPEIQEYIGNKVRMAEGLREEAKRLKKEAEDIFEKEFDIDYSLIEQLPRFSYVDVNNITTYKLNSEYYHPKYIYLEKQLGKKLINFDKLIENVTNGPHGGVEYVDSVGVPYLRAQNIDECSVNLDNIVFIKEEDHIKNKRAEVVPGDIIVVITGFVGMAGIIPEWIPRANIIQSLVKVNTKVDVNDKYYLVYYLNSKIGQMFSFRQASVTVQPGLNFDSLQKVQLVWPEKHIRESIAIKINAAIEKRHMAENLILQAKQDVEDLIEEKFDESKIIKES
jgi:type I restriction enzyme S subunit